MSTERDKRIKDRNILVDEYFAKLSKKHPEWKLDSLLKTTAEAFPPLAPRTVQAIINGEYDRRAQLKALAAKGDPNQLSLL